MLTTARLLVFALVFVLAAAPAAHAITPAGFEWNIRLGDLITVGGFIIAGLTAWFSMKGDVRVLKHDFNSMKTAVETMAASIKVIGEMTLQMTKQEQRIQFMERQVDELRRGIGFIGVRVSSADAEPREELRRG